MAEDKKTKPADLDGDGTVTNKEQEKYDKKQRSMSADELESSFLKSEYAWAWKLIKSNDQLWELWNEAIDNRWEVSKFMLKFRDTDYYQKHTESWLKVEALKKTKPEAYKEQKRLAAARIRDDAASMGARISEKRALDMADKYLRLGFNDPSTASSYQDWLGKRVKRKPGQGFSGVAGTNQTAISNSLVANGFDPQNDKWAKWTANQVKKIAVGDTTVEDSEDYIRRQAAGKYRAFGDEMIATGRDLTYYATPYMASMQEVLELPDSDVNLQDSYIKRALEGYQDEKGQWKQMSTYDFEKELRSDERWKTTRNAHDAGNALLNTVLRRFGVNA